MRYQNLRCLALTAGLLALGVFSNAGQAFAHCEQANSHLVANNAGVGSEADQSQLEAAANNVAKAPQANLNGQSLSSFRSVEKTPGQSVNAQAVHEPGSLQTNPSK